MLGIAAVLQGVRVDRNAVESHCRILNKSVQVDGWWARVVAEEMKRDFADGLGVAMCLNLSSNQMFYCPSQNQAPSVGDYYGSGEKLRTRTAGSSQQARRGEWVDPCLKQESLMRKDNKVRTKNWGLDKVEREENPFVFKKDWGEGH